ncbi:MAG: hypothetical protein EHM41_00955 [Chloroflexi bacterium]|nr:MAG: hypothetical protein EHM41_00955 [Chloroflexota bacterium]
MEITDIIIVAGVLYLVLTYKGGYNPIFDTKRDRVKANFYDFYRRNGVDLLRAEAIIKELKKRGFTKMMPNPWKKDSDKFEAMAELETLLWEVKNVPEDLGTQETDVLKPQMRGESLWARHAESDDS